MALIQQAIVLSIVFAFGFLTYDHLHGGDRYLKPWAYKAQAAQMNKTTNGTLTGTHQGAGALRQVAQAGRQGATQDSAPSQVQDDTQLSPEEKMGRDLRRAQDALREHQNALKTLTEN